MTKPATASEYITMPVATVVGGTLKLSTMPPMATGSDATLNDISDLAERDGDHRHPGFLRSRRRVAAVAVRHGVASP